MSSEPSTGLIKQIRRPSRRGLIVNRSTRPSANGLKNNLEPRMWAALRVSRANAVLDGIANGQHATDKPCQLCDARHGESEPLTGRLEKSGSLARAGRQTAILVVRLG